MKKVGIVAKTRLTKATSHLVEIGAWLEQRGVEPVYETATAALMPPGAARHVADKQTLVKKVDMVVVLGGDGTLLSMADCIGAAGSGIPMLGVNFGSLGFLTEVILPELYPSLDAFLLTPIAPHTLTNRPIVIPVSSPVRVQPNIEDEREELYVTFDGQAGFQLQAGDEIRICRADRTLRLVRPSTRSYFAVLREKLKWGER